MPYQNRVYVLLIGVTWVILIAKETESEVQYRESSVKLLDGNVMVYYNGIWGSVCHDGWDMVDADIVCKELGYPDGVSSTFKKFDYYTLQQDSPIWLSDISCEGTEHYLADCQHDGWYDHVDCDHRFVINVNCNTPDNLYPRLHNGMTWYEGRVDVWDDNHWVGVCGDVFDEEEASVVCRQLGFNDVDKVYDYDKFSGNNIIQVPFPYPFDCKGDERRISHCDQEKDRFVKPCSSVAIRCSTDEPLSTAAMAGILTILVFIFATVVIAFCVTLYMRKCKSPDDPTASVPVTTETRSTNYQWSLPSSPPQNFIEDLPPSYEEVVSNPTQYQILNTSPSINPDPSFLFWDRREHSSSQLFSYC
ncbi:Neurotrypsin [Holothuria leucospilota]|uniref:Neurotrypsin n=1 Tax=Holothuria leucospilota TaxID=206669 RepID=A0A9Q0YQC0_HOLLE|nr:Neurotrypsin [Holothuria leucospilota]